MREMNDIGMRIEEKMNRLFAKRLIYKISLFVLLLTQMFLCANALTDWDQAGFLFGVASKKALALLVISVTVILFVLWSVWKKFVERMDEKIIRIIVAVMIGAAFALQLYFLLHVRSLYLFDNAFVTGGASTLALGEGVAKQANYYFSVYPNQNAYIVLTAVLWKVGSMLGLSSGQIPILLNAVNLVCLDISFVLLYLIFVMVRERTFSQRVSMLTAILFQPFLYIGVCYYYTITLSMPFFMGIIYLYFKLVIRQEKSTVRGYLWMGLLFAVGYLLRATTVIPMIAILCVWLYFGPRRKEMLLVLLTGILCISLLGKWNTAKIGLDTTDTAFPAMHWVMMSMTSPGCHNAEDETFTASFPTKEEKKAAVKARLKEKMDDMSKTDMGVLLLEKMKNTWGDGINGYTVYLENCVNTDGIYEAVFGQHKDGVILYHQVYYLFMMLLFIKNILAGMKKPDWISYVWQLSYLGGILFYLLWETSGQYSIPFLPLLMLGAMDCFAKTGECAKESAENDKNRDGKKIRDNDKENDKENDKLRETPVYRKYPGYGLYILAVCYVLFFFIRLYPDLTKQTQEFSHPVVRQILANDEISIGKHDSFIQSFATKQAFNQIVFQYTKDREENSAVYEIELTDVSGEICYRQEINLKDAPLRTAAVLPFECANDGREKHFRLRIEQVSGEEADRMGIISYSMGHYDALPTGECILNGETLEQDMLLAVNCSENKPYTTKRRYAVGLFVFGSIVCLPIFTFLVYTIQYMAFFRKERKSQ